MAQRRRLPFGQIRFCEERLFVPTRLLAEMSINDALGLRHNFAFVTLLKIRWTIS
jgi:hypothetical protein